MFSAAEREILVEEKTFLELQVCIHPAGGRLHVRRYDLTRQMSSAQQKGQ